MANFHHMGKTHLPTDRKPLIISDGTLQDLFRQGLLEHLIFCDF